MSLELFEQLKTDLKNKKPDQVIIARDGAQFDNIEIERVNEQGWIFLKGHFNPVGFGRIDYYDILTNNH